MVPYFNYFDFVSVDLSPDPKFEVKFGFTPHIEEDEITDALDETNATITALTNLEEEVIRKGQFPAKTSAIHAHKRLFKTSPEIRERGELAYKLVLAGENLAKKLVYILQ